MLKRILSFSLILTASTILMSSCSKDKENPLPAILFTNSATFTFKDVVQTKMVATSTVQKNSYVQTGTSGGNKTVFNITFANKPTKDTTVDLSESGIKVTLTVVESQEEGGTAYWNASTGIIKTTVKDGITTSSFTNINFTKLGGESASGTGTISTKD